MNLPTGGQGPLRISVRRQIEAMVLEQDLSDTSPIPPEGQLIDRFDVSRGTLRTAIQDLASAGLLRTEQGRGTFVNKETQARLQVWDRLAAVARPDSRFHTDYRQFVPDFVGRDICDDALQKLECWDSARTVFIAPDNSMEEMRRLGLDQGKRVLVPTYGLARGFVLLEPDRVPADQRPLAATLDGMERLGKCVDVGDLASVVGPVDLALSGAVAVTTSGVHIGADTRFLAVEWELLTQLELVSDQTPLVVSVHDCQVLDADMQTSSVTRIATFVVTPTQVIDLSERSIPEPRSTSRTNEREVLQIVRTVMDGEDL